MTDTHAEHPGHGQVRQEEDRIAPRPIVAVGIASLVVFFLASWVTIAYLRVKQGDRPPLPVAPELGQSKIALVEQTPFDLVDRGERAREASRRRLESYGWVDRPAGVVHLPIERAMELVAGGARPRASGPGAAAPGGQP